MAYGLGSRNSNRIAMGVYALIAVVWSGWRLFDYARASDVHIVVAPLSGTPPTAAFGGFLDAGNVVELSVPKTDVERLSGLIDFFRFSEILVALLIILAGMVFLYRFCDRVNAGRAFGTGTTLDLAGLATCVVLFPFVTGMLRQLGTNSVVGALSLGDTVETARSFDGMWIAVVVAVFLQFVYAAVKQGTKLTEDTEGLV